MADAPSAIRPPHGSQGARLIGSAREQGALPTAIRVAHSSRRHCEERESATKQSRCRKVRSRRKIWNRSKPLHEFGIPLALRNLTHLTESRASHAFAGAAPYCSSVTCSSQVTWLPSSASCIATCTIATVGEAPCQCFSLGA